MGLTFLTMPSKNKNKGKNAKKNKSKGNKQNKQHGNKNKSKGQQNKRPNSPKKPNPQQVKQQQQLIQSKMIEHIDAMYSEHTQKHKAMRSFFGIFTKHNQLQLRVLMYASIPNINEQITDKFLKTTQSDDTRDINGFIFHGDVVIGATVTEITNGSKKCWIRAFCVLPYFQNFGFGSRLLVNLIKNGVQRKKLNTICLFIDEENKKGIAFFERFGFKNKDNENDGIQSEDKSEDDVKRIKLTLDLRIYRSSIMVLVKKELKQKNETATNSH